MAETKARKAHGLKAWRERRTARRAQTGDTPEKQAEARRTGDPSVKDSANRAAVAGFLSGGV
jgi:hypothetical protein